MAKITREVDYYVCDLCAGEAKDRHSTCELCGKDICIDHHVEVRAQGSLGIGLRDCRVCTRCFSPVWAWMKGEEIARVLPPMKRPDLVFPPEFYEEKGGK